MDVRLTWTDCEEAGDYLVPNVLSPRDLVSRPDIMDKTTTHNTHSRLDINLCQSQWSMTCRVKQLNIYYSKQ